MLFIYQHIMLSCCKCDMCCEIKTKLDQEKCKKSKWRMAQKLQDAPHQGTHSISEKNWNDKSVKKYIWEAMQRIPPICFFILHLLSDKIPLHLVMHQPEKSSQERLTLERVELMASGNKIKKKSIAQENYGIHRNKQQPKFNWLPHPAGQKSDANHHEKLPNFSEFFWPIIFSNATSNMEGLYLLKQKINLCSWHPYYYKSCSFLNFSKKEFEWVSPFEL